MNANKDADDQPEMVLVPRQPTEGMLRAAADSALAESAAGVWEDMIEEWLAVQKRKLVER